MQPQQAVVKREREEEEIGEATKEAKVDTQTSCGTLDTWLSQCNPNLPPPLLEDEGTSDGSGSGGYGWDDYAPDPAQERMMQEVREEYEREQQERWLLRHVSAVAGSVQAHAATASGATSRTVPMSSFPPLVRRIGGTATVIMATPTTKEVCMATRVVRSTSCSAKG